MKQHGLSRITFLTLLSVFSFSTIALTKYAQAMGGGCQEPMKKGCKKEGMCKMCGMPKSKCTCPKMKGEHKHEKKWCEAHGKKDMCWTKAEQGAKPEQLKEVKLAEFKSLVASGKPVVVKFHAEWCSVCHAMKPLDVDMAKAYKNVTLVQVDFEKHRELAKEYQVVGFPTYVFFKGGRQVDMHAGKLSKDKYKQKVSMLAGK